MKHYPETLTSTTVGDPRHEQVPSMTPGLVDLLAQLRDFEDFNPGVVANKKATRLNAYLRAHKLKSCVVAVSGGVDSALVLALANLAQAQDDSPIQSIVPVLLPVHTPGAATNQDVATERGKALCRELGLDPVVIDLSAAHQATQSLVDAAMAMQGEGWASGQLVSYQRTPALYYVTSLQSQRGMPGILLGTTNEDEGAYLGYFGKASDGLVDVQLISDLSKHRVREISAHLGVPRSILEAVPTGDMYDGRTDEQVFGVPYDFVELFLRTKKRPDLSGPCLPVLDDESIARFALLKDRVEQLHRYNAHKYLGRSPAIHLDLEDVSFPGSWNYSVWRG